MNGIGILATALCLVLALAATLWLVRELRELDSETQVIRTRPRRTVSRTIYGRDWDRILRETKLEKGGKRK